MKDLFPPSRDPESNIFKALFLAVFDGFMFWFWVSVCVFIGALFH